MGVAGTAALWRDSFHRESQEESAFAPVNCVIGLYGTECADPLALRQGIVPLYPQLDICVDPVPRAVMADSCGP